MNEPASPTQEATVETNKRSPLIFIFLTVFIDLLSVGIVVPLLPYYVKLIEQADTSWITSNRALIVGALAASYALFQFLFSPVLGALSDRFGRRPVLLISLAGTGISYIIFGIADQLLPLGIGVVLSVLFFARIMDGITGANISTAQAYIADVTKPEDRAKGLGLIGAAFGMGFMLGPAIGGLLSTISLSTPAFVAAALTFANVIFGFFRLPESLPVERRTQVPFRKMNPISRLQGVVQNTDIRPLLLGALLVNFAFAGLQNNFAVFSDIRFGLGPTENAFMFAFIGLMAVLMQGFLLRKLLPRFGEPRLAVMGLGLMTFGFAMIAAAPAAWMLYPALGVLAAGSGMATPSITSMISRSVAPEAQGSILGGVQSFNSLMMVAGPLFAGTIFDLIGPAAPYVSGALIVSAAGAVITNAVRSQLAAPPQPAPLAPALEAEQPV
ncbi:major facilitator superfamily MFS_1 [Oscillochloris trichoides DG-6]|uniref:Major facilitator superfamily MFS_1 n=1 Tax=Oscillochloris trichoides DG-6 TaxID=765420 RepID=E1IHL5_9CHLR|nr:major facilitator superfamily MFS_1 [Oscillochloris trichoides DG-6]